MKLAILGGTFNPPHYGHLFYANEIRNILKYDKIVFVPSAISAHKKNDLSVTDLNRLNMIKLATSNLKWASVSDCDIIRGGVTRSIDTINDICKEFKLLSKPGFIIGDDLISGFDNWFLPQKISEMSDIIIGTRNNSNIEFNYKHVIVNNRSFSLSSSEIRERVAKGLYIDFLLPEKVVEYIEANGLYRKY